MRMWDGGSAVNEKCIPPQVAFILDGTTIDFEMSFSYLISFVASRGGCESVVSANEKMLIHEC